LKVGSTFTAYGATFTVAAIYDAGNTFANAGLIMPLPTVQRLSGQTGDITSATVTVDSVDNLNSTTAAITKKLGSAADVVNSQTTATTAIAPLKNIKTISLFSLIGAVVAGAVIILLTMLMIVRERRREIGVMKAIGASNLKTTLQFVCEAITFTVLGAIIGLGIGVAAASPLTKVLVNNSSSSTNSVSVPGGGGGGGFRIARSFGANSITNIKNIQTTIGWSILLYGFLAALLIAILGSAIPAYLISKVRPAEVMRAE
jgi:putative ABC transport system permease protein